MLKVMVSPKDPVTVFDIVGIFQNQEGKKSYKERHVLKAGLSVDEAVQLGASKLEDIANKEQLRFTLRTATKQRWMVDYELVPRKTTQQALDVEDGLKKIQQEIADRIPNRYDKFLEDTERG